MQIQPEQKGDGSKDNKSTSNEPIVEQSVGVEQSMESIDHNDGSNQNKKNVDEEELDPLEEYMSIISQQLKEIKDSTDIMNRVSKGAKSVLDISNQGLGGKQQNKERLADNSDAKSTLIEHSSSNATQPNNKRVVIVRTQTVKKEISKNNDKNRKGDIMEQNADALEYSSEEYSDDEMYSCRKSKADSINANHDKIYYRRFRKRFYSEVPEIANMTADEVTQYRLEMDDIQVTGKRCPRPIKTWAQCITYLSILDLLKRFGMDKPTPIQCQSLPIIGSGRDMLGIAKTGSGKTLAFLLPMLRHIKTQPPLEPDDGPIGIVITPTRELAMQIAKECKRFCRVLDLRVVAVFGGTGISEQIADLKRGTEIVVCTPGRMIDMLAANNGKVTNLRRITYVVIDEADRMFDMGFEPQVNKILECIRPDRQTVMFSATFPRQMEALARRALFRPIEVVVGGKSVVCDSVEQQVFVIHDDQKYLKLLELLGIYQEYGSVLVFVHKQEHADELMKNLMSSSYPCMALHGGIDQYDRDSVLSYFKSGYIRLLIATSLAARGIDVKDLILVVNYDCPNHYEDYVHRCGRTGRAGKSGVAATFITPSQDKLAGDVIKALELSNHSVPEELRQLWDGYRQRMQLQGVVKIKSGTGGFGGKGFKFDDEEQAFSDDRKRVQKLMYSANGMQVDDFSDDDEVVDIDNEIDKTLKSKTRVKHQSTEEGDTSSFLPPTSLMINSNDDATTKPGDEIASFNMVDGSSSSSTVSNVNAEKLAFAKQLAARLGPNGHMADLNDILSNRRNPQTTNSSSTLTVGNLNGRTFKSLSNEPNNTQIITSKSLAEQIAGKLNSKLNYTPRDRSSLTVEDQFGQSTANDESQKSTVKVYEEELEINDFPQNARWKVTSKETLSNIAEYAEAAITVRGKYFPSGKQPPPGESRLYLTIEALTERGLQLAKAEIKRMIKEEMLKMQNPALQMVNRGRYKVL